ncbi:MAG TPA: RDD family protein [Myxococcaceae bacterium]|nr:RDD family protein [Myxococcaceae bacterium]
MPTASTPSLEVATPERVALSLPVAGIGYRSLAYLIDVLLLLGGWLVAYFVFSLVVRDTLAMVQSLSGLGQTLAIVGLFATQWLYWSLFEIFWNGQTPGKRLMRIRVARVDGSPVTALESFVRNLCRAVDFLPVFYATGIIAMLFDAHHRRLGDLLAGTLLLRDERIDLDKYAVPTTAMEPAPERAAAPLPAADVEMILSFLERAPQLEPAARERLTRSLVERFGGHLGPEEKTATLASPHASEAFLRQRARG